MAADPSMPPRSSDGRGAGPVGYDRLARAVVGACALALLAPEGALAHADAPVARGDLLARWRPEPSVVILVLLAGWLYLRGAGVIARHRREPAERRGVIAFLAGLGTLLIALASPLDLLAGTLFSAHMVQHVLLVAVAPPLLLLGQPLPTILAGLPRHWRRRLNRGWRSLPGLRRVVGVLITPVVAWVVHALAIWLWHLPTLYDEAVRSEPVHILEHAVFLGTALAFWWGIIQPERLGGLNPGVGILSIFAMGMQGAALGAVFAFASGAIYPVYTNRTEAWGLSVVSDQRLAGFIMWIPAGLIYVAAALLLLGRWLTAEAPTRPARRKGHPRTVASR